MKATTTTTTTTTTRRRRPLGSKRPSLVDGPCSLLSSTSTAMLSFLARLSGRRRRWRHAPRDQQQPTVASMCDQQAAQEETGCARCRAHSCCSCELLGLDSQQRQQEQLQAHCRRSRHSTQDSRQSACSSLALQRRRPPERAKCKSSAGGGAASYLAVTLLCLLCVSVADACSSRSTPKARPPTPTPRPNITFHMYTCAPDYAEWYCLNGATCFTVKIVDSLLYNCLCANGYIGQRCEFKDLEGSYMHNRRHIMLETASIAGAVTIAVFLAVITFISVYIHCKRKQKELLMMSNGNGVDVVDGPPRDPELRPFCSRSRSLMIFMAKNPDGSSSTAPPIEQTRMPNWSAAPTRMVSVNESKR